MSLQISVTNLKMKIMYLYQQHDLRYHLIDGLAPHLFINHIWLDLAVKYFFVILND